MFATAQDVAVEMGEATLTSDQQDFANAKIAALEALIRLRYPTLVARTQTNPDLAVLVTSIVATAVARVLRNPDGKIQEAIDDYSFRRADTADGSLTLTEAEWDALAATTAPNGTTTAFTVGARAHPTPQPRFWDDYYPVDPYGEVML